MCLDHNLDMDHRAVSTLLLSALARCAHVISDDNIHTGSGASEMQSRRGPAGQDGFATNPERKGVVSEW